MTRTFTPDEIDWKEALNSAIESFRRGDLLEWELHLIGRRVEAALSLANHIRASGTQATPTTKTEGRT